MAARAGEALNNYDAGISSAVAVAGDTTFARITRGLYVGVSGSVVVTFAGDNAPVTLTGLAAGVWHPMQLQSFTAAGSSATGIVAGF